MKTVLLILLASFGASAVTITGVTMQGSYHSAQHFEVSTDAPAWCQLKYGTSPGVYPYTSGVANAGLDGNPNLCPLTLGGLKPGTTYYVMPTVWPMADGDSTTNVCSTTCGGVEVPFQTPPAPAVHPEPPIAPTTWTPVEPDTTGYTVVPVRANATTGYCEAAANVAAPGGVGGSGHWTRSIVAGDSITTIYNSIWYRTVVQLPQGTDCYIPPAATWNTGIRLPRYSPDGGVDDWVVTETAQVNATDFPVFGSRTGPAYASKLATFRAYLPTMPPAFNPSATGRLSGGQLFECDANDGPCGNHFWFRNMRWQDRVDTTIFPTGVTDPDMYGYALHMIPPCSLAGGCLPDDSAAPHHIVIDRIYIPEQGYPSRKLGCFSPGGNYWAIIGTYCETDDWVPAMFPQHTPVTSGATMTVPYSYIQMPTITDPRIGMPQTPGYFGSFTSATPITIAYPSNSASFKTKTGLLYVAGDLVEIMTTRAAGRVMIEDEAKYMMGTVTSYNSTTGDMVMAVTDSSYPGNQYTTWEIDRPNKIIFSGANIATYSGSIIGWIDSTGLTVDYQTAAGVTATCLYATGCHIITEASPDRFLSTPKTSYWIFSASFFGSGSVSITNYHGQNPSRWTAWSPLGIYINSGRYGLYKNNYMAATGQTVYADTVGNLTDLLFEKNFLYFPRNRMENHPTWNGTVHTYRNVIELKELNRGLFLGNIIDGSGSQQNPGNPMYIAGSWARTWSNGATDWDIRGNIFRHISSGFQCAGGGAVAPPDSVPSVRLRLRNNMFLDMNKELYSADLAQVQGASLISGPFTTYPACSDLEFDHNTMGLAKGFAPSLILVGGGSGGPSVFGEGLKFTNNFMLASLSNNFELIDTVAGGAIDSHPHGLYNFTHFPAFPYVPAQHTGTWASRLDGTFFRTGAGSSFTPSWQSGLNVVVAAQSSKAGGWVDIPAAGTDSVASISTAWIDSSSHIIPGSTMAARLTAAGWSSTLDLSSGNPLKYRINASANHGGDPGANVDDVISATGIVTDIKILPGASSLGFSYTAPDSRACTVDVSAGGSTWNRFTDAGGARPRTLVATGLTASTAYQYRLLCYFDQSAAYEFTPDQVTSGTTTTLTNLTGTVSTGFVLPRGAAKVLVTLTPLSGSASSQTCIISSPCAMNNIPNGTYTRTVQPQDLSSIPIGPASVSTITVSTGGGSVAAPTGGGLWDSLVGVIDSLTGLFDDL